MAANHKTFSLSLSLMITTLYVATCLARDLPYNNVAVPIPIPPPPYHGVKAAYWRSWEAQSLPPSAIPTPYFTHVFYAFLLVDPTSFQLLITPNDEQWMAAFTAALHGSAPPANAILSIGGAGADPVVFSNMAASQDNRAAFIRSSIDTARKYGFDGLDLDWEFPWDPRDMSNLGSLFREWRSEVNRESLTFSGRRPTLLLSAAVYFSPHVLYPGNIPRTYPGEDIRSSLDFVGPMCFDYHGGWDPHQTAAHALLYDKTSNLSTSYGVSEWKGVGAPSGKIVMGMPAYGRTWQLEDPDRHGIGAPAVGVGPGGGVMVYSDIVGFNAENNATVVFDNATVSTYSYAGTNWIGYDDATSIEYKVKFAKAQGLGGYFFWVLGDDSNWALAKAASIAWDSEN
ncbi:hypothetical protein ACP275_11G035800 [Erythranthe tilingii]